MWEYKWIEEYDGGKEGLDRLLRSCEREVVDGWELINVTNENETNTRVGFWVAILKRKKRD